MSPDSAPDVSVSRIDSACLQILLQTDVAAVGGLATAALSGLPHLLLDRPGRRGRSSFVVPCGGWSSETGARDGRGDGPCAGRAGVCFLGRNPGGLVQDWLLKLV